eukprot:3221934-Amphidinium_carterae.1
MRANTFSKLTLCQGRCVSIARQISQGETPRPLHLLIPMQSSQMSRPNTSMSTQSALHEVQQAVLESCRGVACKCCLICFRVETKSATNSAENHSMPARARKYELGTATDEAASV